jgi:hypothetical protein
MAVALLLFTTWVVDTSFSQAKLTSTLQGITLGVAIWALHRALDPGRKTLSFRRAEIEKQTFSQVSD